MKPWLVVTVGVVLGLAAAWVLLDQPRDERRASNGARTASGPSGEIRAESRQQMRDLLREAEGGSR